MADLIGLCGHHDNDESDPFLFLIFTNVFAGDSGLCHLGFINGAKEDYSSEVLEEEKIQAALLQVIQEEEKDIVDNRQAKVPKLARTLQGHPLYFSSNFDCYDLALYRIDG